MAPMKPNNRPLLIPMLTLVALASSSAVISEADDTPPEIELEQMTPLEEAELMLKLCQRALLISKTHGPH